MAKASINFQKSKHNSVAETTREFEAHYLLPKEHRLENEYWNCGKSDSQIFQDELAKANRKGGRVPKEENSLWEAVINLNKEHRLEDVQRVAKHIEEKFNVICTRIAVHRDEGHINERGIVEYNLHAHLNFVTYKDGKQNWRREHITPQNLSQLQTDIAQTLNMTRGKEGSEAVRLGHKQQRVIAKEREAVQYSFREYQQRITALENTSAEDKKEIHKLNNLVKKGEATIQDLEKRLQEALESKKSLETIKDTPKEVKSDFRPLYAPKIAYKTVEIKTGMFGSEKQEVLPKKEALALEVYAEEQAKRIKALERQNTDLKGQNEVLKEVNGYQEARIKELTFFEEQYNIIVKKLKEYTGIKMLKEAIEAIKAKFLPTQEAKREEKPNVFQTIQAEADTHLKEQKPLKGKELMDEVQRLNEQGKKNMEYAKEQSKEPEKKKPKSSWRDRG